MLTSELTYDQLDTVISRAAGRTLTPNEAFEYCEAQGLYATTNQDTTRGEQLYLCAYDGGEALENSPVLAIKRAFVLKQFGASVEV